MLRDAYEDIFWQMRQDMDMLFGVVQDLRREVREAREREEEVKSQLSGLMQVNTKT